MEKFTAIVLAGGTGKRMHSHIHKQYLTLAGKPVLYYALKAFEESEDVYKRQSLHYCVDGEGISVTQGDADAKLMWDQVYKMVSTKNNVLVYSNRVNAYVIPRQQLGEKYRELAEIAKEKLPKYRVKLK